MCCAAGAHSVGPRGAAGSNSDGRDGRGTAHAGDPGPASQRARRTVNLIGYIVNNMVSITQRPGKQVFGTAYPGAGGGPRQANSSRNPRGPGDFAPRAGLD